MTISKLSLNFIIIFCLLLAGCARYGSSQRSGEIVKIASEGYIIKTTEVEIIKGSLNGGSGSFGSKFDFTISNPNLIQTARKAFNEGKEITVSYHSTAFCPFSSETRDCAFADEITLK